MHQVQGAEQVLTEIYLIGNTKALAVEDMRTLPGVDRVVRISEEYKVLGRHKDDTRPSGFEYQGVQFSQDTLNIFAGLCAVDSPESVEAMMRPRVASQVQRLDELLAGARYRDFEGNEHNLRLDDILVIAPFNAQVKCLEARLPAGARIGTVDKFQGQEAQVVFFSLATSSGAEVPRSLEFLLSRNRLNVAVSRARCLAFVVASPGLLDIDCATVGQMRLVNALCRVAENVM